jgi:diaminopimelate epimerase
MKNIKFTKMSGAGNDFIVIDNYSGKIKLSTKQIASLCRRGLSIGADGLMLLEKAKEGKYAFKMRYYNSDGREAEMCGNGGRCISRFAYMNKRAPARMFFIAADGEHTAEVMKNKTVKLGMVKPGTVNLEFYISSLKLTGGFVNTGVPHFVVEVKDIDKVDVKNLGRTLRFHKAFAPKGTNVNFIQKTAAGSYRIRTYERGVEDETLACGTGAVAAAITLNAAGKVKSPVAMKANGGMLKIYFKKDCCSYNNVFLEGPASVVMEGTVMPEAYK